MAPYLLALVGGLWILYVVYRILHRPIAPMPRVNPVLWEVRLPAVERQTPPIVVAVPPAKKRSRKTIAKAAKAVSKTAKKAAKAVSKTAKRGTKAVSKTAKKGAKAVSKAAKKGAKKVSKAFRKLRVKK